MWLLSGAFFPITGAPTWLQWVMRANPMTYGVAALRRALYQGHPELGVGLPSGVVAASLLAGFCVVTLAIDLLVVTRERN
jgi:ABC-2 type transport system permease protein